MTRYDQAHNFIQSRIGGYPNWNTVITDEDGTDSDNQAVFDLLEKIGFLDYTNEPWTTCCEFRHRRLSYGIGAKRATIRQR